MVLATDTTRCGRVSAALENAGIAVDPRTHSLERLHAKPLKSGFAQER